jgi:diadenosine tetraphosphatase ApaH/serine/threonine PP2A family protein phosphatase
LELLDRVAPDRTVLVGDLFTKGPDPVGVFRAVRELESVRGNHELRLLQIVDGERLNDSGGQRTLDALAVEPSWLEWTRSLPLFLEVQGFTVVHAGLHPSGSLERTTPDMATRMRRFPDESPESPFWWSQYTGHRRVIFGHDAARGLIRVERAGRVQLLGLDTGCVYGGALSGYLIEADEVVSVQARRAYRPV